ncbi:hypothetical protein K469DRAFT_337347 [Zopfia rhizophila CBS 207.26]|uniref:Uncharacterized protein n=1 Tax=Zopfia rhizophila CBS 207.26 TaxID=1314779 RepID=A0A6A6DJF1_9PEZI|nr:hypothetical protein K469DRAFT_337347 [Zopfia rhizophila CBS 207.26]
MMNGTGHRRFMTDMPYCGRPRKPRPLNYQLFSTRKMVSRWILADRITARASLYSKAAVDTKACGESAFLFQFSEMMQLDDESYSGFR